MQAILIKLQNAKQPSLHSLTFVRALMLIMLGQKVRISYRIFLELFKLRMEKAFSDEVILKQELQLDLDEARVSNHLLHN